MGLYVHLSVVFACDNNEGVAKLAKKHLLKVKADEESTIEAEWFLEELSGRTGGNPGPKGGLSLWGVVGNYTSVEDFVGCLKEFWLDLLYGNDGDGEHEEVEGGPCAFEHILVFEEREQSERATAYEIFLENEGGKRLKVLKHECPFAWMQF